MPYVIQMFTHQMDAVKIIKDGKIGYKEQDNIVFNLTYGYNTLFAYFKEHDKGNITKEVLDQKKYFQIRCGNFSYTKLIDNFDYILGVTGTLSVLNKEEKRIIKEDFKIKHKTYTPSIYGNNNLTFKPSRNFCICEGDDYFKKIAENVKSGLSVEKKGDIRAVLIFFESKKILDNFFSSYNI